MYQGIFKPHLAVVSEWSCEVNPQACLLLLGLTGPIYGKMLNLHCGAKILFHGHKLNLRDSLVASC